VAAFGTLGIGSRDRDRYRQYACRLLAGQRLATT
jgi:hypothetical protein